MIFSNPSLLWAALGVFVPMAIHLWSRKKEVTIKIGSIKLLRKSEAEHSSAIRLNEWWLLLLRILMIVLLALVLAGPHLNMPVKNIPLTYLVEPSLLLSEKMEKLLDTLPADATRVLADGFPEIKDYDLKSSDKTPPKYWQLAQEMAYLPSDSLIVFTKALVSGIRGIRPRTEKTINFVIMEDENTSERVLEARRKSDSVELFTMAGDGKRLRFETKKVSLVNKEIKIDEIEDSVAVGGRQLPLQRSDPLRVLVVYADSLFQEMRYFSAAYRAISKYLERDISVHPIMDIDSVDFDNYDFSIWLGKNPIKNDSVPHLTYRSDVLADALIVPGEQKNEYQLTARLNSENIISGYLAEKLLMLLPLHQDFEREVARYDQRSMDADAIRPESGAKASTSKPMERMDISPWFWGFLIFTMIAERILAKYRKQ